MRERVSSARVGRLCTVTAEIRPHVVPCCFVLAGDIVYSATDDLKPKISLHLRRVANLRAHPSAALLVDHYAEDWATLWWVRLDGTGRVVEAADERAAALRLLTAKYEQYARRPPPGDVLAIDVHTWRAWP